MKSLYDLASSHVNVVIASVSRQKRYQTRFHDSYLSLGASTNWQCYPIKCDRSYARPHSDWAKVKLGRLQKSFPYWALWGLPWPASRVLVSPLIHHPVSLRPTRLLQECPHKGRGILWIRQLRHQASHIRLTHQAGYRIFLELPAWM